MKCYQIDLCGLLQVQLLNMETLIPPEMHITRYTTEYILYVITEGELKLEVNGERRCFVPGDVILFNKGDYQKPIESTYCQYYYVHFLSDGIEQMDMDETVYNELLEQRYKNCLKANIYSLETYQMLKIWVCDQYSIHNQSVFEYLTKVLHDHSLSYHSKFPANRLAVSRAVEDVLIHLESLRRADTDKTARLTLDIASYIERNYAQNFSGKDLEQIFYRNFDYLNRVFSKSMGSGIIQYRNQIRINEAKMKLLTTDFSVGEIAEAVGINSPYYFSRFFRKKEGLTPTEYREKNHQGR